MELSGRTMMTCWLVFSSLSAGNSIRCEVGVTTGPIRPKVGGTRPHYFRAPPPQLSFIKYFVSKEACIKFI